MADKMARKELSTKHANEARKILWELQYFTAVAKHLYQAGE